MAELCLISSERRLKVKLVDSGILCSEEIFEVFSTGDVGYIVVVEYNAAFKQRREWSRADESTDLYHHF